MNHRKDSIDSIEIGAFDSKSLTLLGITWGVLFSSVTCDVFLSGNKGNKYFLRTIAKIEWIVIK